MSVEPDVRESADWIGGGEETFVLLPRLSSPGEYVSVFEDGSWTYWVPEAARVAESRLGDWWGNAQGSLVGALALMLCDGLLGGILG